MGLIAIMQAKYSFPVDPLAPACNVVSAEVNVDPLITEQVESAPLI